MKLINPTFLEAKKSVYDKRSNMVSFPHVFDHFTTVLIIAASNSGAFRFPRSIHRFRGEVV